MQLKAPRVAETSLVETPSLNDPTHWWKRASEMRRLAADTRDPESKRIILKLAADDKKLAERAGERLRDEGI
jgi:hypothetical protein